MLNKKAAVKKAYTAIERATAANLKIRGQLIVGSPGETDETVEETAEFMRKASGVEKFGLHIFQPVPGCDIATNPEKYNYKIKRAEDFSDYHTIGKPGVLETKDPQVVKWYTYLREVAGRRNIDGAKCN
jgi:radical SAM superfamily enzyme YgiQ (UPF0313 family)